MPRAGLELEAARRTAALLTATAHGPLTDWLFVGSSDFGLGLFARTALRTGQASPPLRSPASMHPLVSCPGFHQQALSEYAGPRLPCSLHQRGQCALQIPGTEVLIDGASENSPFALPRCSASYANHSERPNARLELWPVLRPALCEVRQHMVLVAAEPIEAGCEIRIDYDAGRKRAQYWGVATGMPVPCQDDAWRHERRTPPPPAAAAEPLVDGLLRLQRAARAPASDAEAASGALVRMIGDEPVAPLPWDGARGGDARLLLLVPRLAKKLHGLKDRPGSSHWAIVASHLPGRSGRECSERWFMDAK